ncbi:hypothetical protein D915_002308 [Fasciola hepatica]|uniref:Uncharacterized protein n=1 Tax=Fasciola hepatica TaxID=6192 RepID=A0A4E0RM57_FASHE|nr:hypothetical protein D915_002308 [Fasciola hepatica]
MSISKVLQALPADLAPLINMGFIRYAPFLNEEDWSLPLQWLPQELQTRQILDLVEIPERILWTIITVFAFIWAHLKNENHNRLKPMDCYTTPHSVYETGEVTRNWMREVLKSDILESYKFYSLETLQNGTKRFRATARIDASGKLSLTDLGRRIFRQTIISGLFANRFHGFPDREIRAGVIQEEPLVIGGKRVKNGTLVNATGMIIDILDLFAEKFSFRYQVVLSSDGLFGTQEKDGSWSGLIGDLIEERIDLIAFPLSVTAERSKVVHFLTSFMDDSVGILMSRSTAKRGFFLIMRPFSSAVWVLIMISFLVAASVAFLLCRLSPAGRERTDQLIAIQSNQRLSDGLYCYIQSFLFHGAEWLPTMNSGRVVILFFWISLLLMHSFWQANITAHLTKEVVQLPVKNLDELAVHKFVQPLLIHGTALYSMFQNSAPGTPYRRIYEKYRLHGHQAWNMSTAIELLFSDPRMALVGDVHLLRHAVDNHCGGLVLSDSFEWHNNLGFATLHQVSFSPPLAKYIRHMMETGITERLRKKWWFRTNACVNKPKYKPLNLSMASGALLMISLAALVGILTLAGERFWTRCGPMLNWRVIYDEYFDTNTFDLNGALQSYLPVMGYVLEQSFTNGSSFESPEWIITVRKFAVSEVCALIELGARMIASLTSCAVSRYIDSVTTRHHILHYAIPRPMCLTRPSMPSDDTMHTMWYQPEPSDLAHALYKINEFENVGRGLILSNGQTDLSKLILILSSTAASQGQKFRPLYATQDFSIVEDAKSFYPGAYTARIPLSSILSALIDPSGVSTGAASLSHIIVLTPVAGVIQVLEKLVLYSAAAKRYMWIFGEPVDFPARSLLNLLALYPIKTMNMAFFRYFPILNKEDCNDESLDKLLRDTAIHFSDCDYGKVPLGVLHKMTGFTFYALETDTENSTRFVSTARYLDREITLTEDGVAVAEGALVSGLFPNRFRNFSNGLILIGMVLDAPFVMDYEISAAGHIVKARGLMIDLVDILAERFGFRYRLYPATNGHSGELSARGDWTGLIGDLQNKRVDLAASYLLQNKERDGVGAFLGHVEDGRIGLLVAKPTTEGKLFNLLQIYQPDVLALLLITALITSAMLYAFERFSPFSNRNQNRSARPRTERSHLGEQLWNVVKSTLGRSDITSFLTRTNYKPVVQSLGELASDTTINPVIIRGSGVYEFFEESNSQVDYQVIFRRVVDGNLVVPNTTVAVSKVLADATYVVVGDYETLRYAQLTNCQKLIIVNTGVSMGQQSMMALKDVDWGKPFSTYLDQLKESGILDALKKRWWELESICEVGQVKYRSLNLEALEELFIFLSIFIAMALVFLALEWLWMGVIRARIIKRRQKRAAKLARMKRRLDRGQAPEGQEVDDSSDYDDSESSGLED